MSFSQHPRGKSARQEQSKSTIQQSQKDIDVINMADQLINHNTVTNRELFVSEIGAPGQRNRPTIATGALEDNSSFGQGHPDFELIGSDYVPSQGKTVN